jgi:formate dehydrogenase major subunit/formate dehydrogenase alpha subunit
VAGLAMSFGSGAMSNSIEDIASEAKAYFVIGSNTTEQHPVIGMRIRQAVKQRGAQLIVADPRRIPLTEFAVIHLQHKPGSDNALINGLMNIILVRLEDKPSSPNARRIRELRSLVQEFTPDSSETTGVPVEQASTRPRDHGHD